MTCYPIWTVDVSNGVDVFAQGRTTSAISKIILARAANENNILSCDIGDNIDMVCNTYSSTEEEPFEETKSLASDNYCLRHSISMGMSIEL